MEKKDENTPKPFGGFAGFGNTTPLAFGAGSTSLFGNNAPVSFNFTPAASFGSSPAKNKNDNGDDDDDDDENGDDGGAPADADESHAATFKALVTLDPIEVKTLEEEEEALVKIRSKLYVFVKEDEYGGEKRTNWWRERGLGEIKILRHKKTGECRLLMRQEKTLKICLNVKIEKNLELKPTAGNEEKSFNFTGADYVDGAFKVELFAIRFGTPEQAASFKTALEEAKSGKGVALPASPAATKASSPSLKPVSPSIKPVTTPSPVKANSKPSTASAEPVSKAPEPVVNPKPVLCGGYQKFDPKDPRAQAAAKFACDKINLGSLVKIASVKSQVVAGTNFRMALHIKYKNGQVHAHVVTVFEPLPYTKDPLSLTEEVHTGIVS